MTTQNKRKDDELEVWVIVGGFFTLVLIGVDLFYSSLNEMAKIAKISLGIGHLCVLVGWVISLINWKDPNWDDARKIVVALCVMLMFVIGIHHAVVVENEQVIIDSKENAAKP